MRSFLVFLLLTSIIYSQADIKTEDGVYVLTESNFDDFVKGEEFTVVEFYAPWCGHCKKLAPEYAKAAQTLASYDPPIKIAKVDTTEEKSLGERFDIKGYPTLKIFRNGEASEYDGPRDAQGIIKYIKSKSAPSSRHLQTADSVQLFINNLHDGGVLYFGDSSSPLFTEFQKVASKLRDSFRFGYAHSPEVSQRFGVTSGDKIIFFQPQKYASKLEQSKVFVEGSTADEISVFLQTKTLPLAGEINTDNKNLYIQRGLPVVVVFTHVDWERNFRGVTYFLNRLRIVGKDYSDKLSFAIASPTEFAEQVSSLGLPEKESSIVILDLKENKKYKKDSATKFSVDNLKDLISDFLSNKLEPYVKSEPIPTSDEGDVKVVVGKNFEQVVLDPSKDVLLEVYAPWCAHCKKLVPIYSQLATSLKPFNDKLVIAKIDATANDLPSQYAVKGFPTIFFVPANQKDKPMKYDGAREVKDFVAFIKKHATFNFDDSLLKDEL